MPVIDNSQNNTLADSLEKILPSCNRIDALVGYFYFSGFQEIYEDLRDKKIRILVGMEMDEKMLDRLSKIDQLTIDSIPESTNPTSSKTVAKARYYEQFATVFNKTDWFDNENAIQGFLVFLDKIKNGTLEIKKTPIPNHAKMYILHFSEQYTQGGLTPGVVISGSSNLTYNGLKGQGERNRILREPHYYEEDNTEFEKLWNSADNIIIANKDYEAEFTIQIKKRLWLYALPEPYLVYLRVLQEYFSTEEVENMKGPYDITDGKYSNLQYQLDAINYGMDRIKKFGGVIIADVVGLGKSIIASAIAHNMGIKTIVIAPPHLEEQWKDYSFEFNFNAQIYSTGAIDKALEKHGKRDEELLIILDEAHKHRNEDTENYKLLHQLCAGNKVMALSATPFNNDPKDIYALIKLFDTPGQSTIRTVENLSIEFRELIDIYKKMRKELRGTKGSPVNEEKIKQKSNEIASKLRMMIDPIVIRRSRRDLDQIEDYKNDLIRQGVSFAKVKDPELLEYDLGPLTEQYIDTLNRISSTDLDEEDERFIGARYQVASYIRRGSKWEEKIKEEFEITNLGEAQKQVAKIMRRLLVRRFESSVFAFQSTLEKMITASEDMLKWYTERKEVPIFKKGGLLDPDEFTKLDEEELTELFAKLEEKGMIRIPAEEVDTNLQRDLESDLGILRGIHELWFGRNSIKGDPKLEYFLETVKSSLIKDPKRKIIVFSEFSDTANYVYAKCREAGLKVFKYSSEDASTLNKEIIRKNFDAGYENQVNDFDILIATDAISEGFNLHRAGAIINYDIPYNPTRVIQRIGRINRINKKVFEELYIYNFFPTSTGEVETKTKAIATLKMNLIHSLLGEDTKVFTDTEELRNYFAQTYRDAEGKSEAVSWDVFHRQMWNTVKHNEDLKKRIEEIPHRTRIARISEKSGVVAFGKRGSSHIFAFGGDEFDIEYISPELALDLFKATEGELPEETNMDFDSVYQKVKSHLFKDNTHPPIKGRRQDADTRLDVLSEIYPPAKDYCDDIRKIIYELDSLPEGVLKDLSMLKIDKENPNETFIEVQKLVPEEYIQKIFSKGANNSQNEQFVLLTEQFLG